MTDAPAPSNLSISRALGIQGWRHLDAVMLASLATESPLLLIGPHGTAKTLLVERIANALNLDFRHYNASLLNYDDLVGIPLPDETNTHLQFVSTPGAIWGTGFVFFDEISRCRSDLQNKLFPIIHERRVIGMDLDSLQHRWAAMNPPSPDEADLDASLNEYYLGSEPLDPALTDRFPYVVPVPNWKQLTKADRRRLIADVDDEPVGFDEHSLDQLVLDCVELIPQVEAEYGEWVTDYIICVMDLLERAKLPQSPRRARMLARSVIAVHSARMVLEGEDVDLEYSAEIALLYGIPQNATEVPPTPATVVAVHRQAWEIANRLDDDHWRQVLEEHDLIQRVILAENLDFDDDEFSRLITQALTVHDSEARNIGLATAMFLAFRHHRSLNPSAWEPLVNLAKKVLTPQTHEMSPSAPRADITMWTTMKNWVLKRREDPSYQAQLEVNYVLSGFPELWRKTKWRDALNHFIEDLARFNIKELQS